VWRKLAARFEQFIRERQFLANASPATIEWYANSLEWLRSESPTQDELKNAVLRMREKGRRATGCNTVIRAINAYLHWNSAGAEKKCGPGCQHLRVPQLKEPQLVLPTFTAAQVKLIVKWNMGSITGATLNYLRAIIQSASSSKTKQVGIWVA